MVKIKTLICLSLPFLMWSCGAMSDAGKALRNEKTTSTDEFLVKKKAPLTLPPDFAEIPAPGALEEKKKKKMKKIKLRKHFELIKQNQIKKLRPDQLKSQY